MRPLTTFLGGDSHAEGLARALPHANEGPSDWQRGRRVADQPRLPLEYDVVVLCLGTNDYDRPGLSAEVRELAETRGGQPLVWVLPLHADRPDLAERRPGVVGRIRAGLSGVPGVRIVDPVYVPTPDGAHATAAGYAEIARQVETTIAGGGASAIVLGVGLLAAGFAAWRWLR